MLTSTELLFLVCCALTSHQLAQCRLERNVITPTTKAEDHDEPISPEQIVERGLMTQQQWQQVRTSLLPLLTTPCTGANSGCAWQLERD